MMDFTKLYVLHVLTKGVKRWWLQY